MFCFWGTARLNFYMARRFLYSLVVSVFALAFCSCSSIPYIYETDQRYDSIDSRTELRPADRGPLSPTKISLAKRMPWETWPLGRDLNGIQLSNENILQGDEYLKNDARGKALEFYTKASRSILTPDEQESLAIRKASLELSLDKPTEALKTLSQFFKSTTATVEDVDPRYSLLFAYAYGRSGNIEQSIAWFSRVNRLEAGRGGLSGSADRGLNLLLKSLSDQDFNSLDSSWTSDAFVSNLIGQERRRRAHRGYEPRSTTQTSPFWQEGLGLGNQVSAQSVHTGETINVGVLLPLSGQYGSLGKSTLNGIKVAEQARGAASGLSLIIKNTEGQPIKAAAQARELLSVNKAAVFIGPLLAEPSEEVGRAIAGSGAPLLSLSKKTGFSFSKGTFRLGPTTESQVQSLVEKTSRGLGTQRYALLYPQTELGLEYATFFRQSVRDNGASLLFDSAYYPGDTAGFIKASQEIIELGVQAIFIPDSIRTASSFATNIPESQRSKIRLLGPASWDNPTQLLRSKALLRGAVFVTPFFIQSERQIIKRFIESYKHTYGKDPDFLAAQGFDAATMMFAAVDRARSESVSVEAAMDSIDLYEGLTGQITIDPNGNLSRRFAVVEVTNAGLSEVMERSEVAQPVKEEVPYYRIDGNV
ncbi:MAG: penicillin-binding protein activator [Bdellovibrionota bacterium]